MAVIVVGAIGGWVRCFGRRGDLGRYGGEGGG